MAIPSPFDNIPPISFATIDVTELQKAVISGFLKAWEEDTGEKLTLLPSDRRYNFLSSATAWLVGAYAVLDESARQNLIGWAHGAFLDNIGAFFDIGNFSGAFRGLRLPASPAITTLSFEIAEVSQDASIIPESTQVASSSSGLVFTTDKSLSIPPGFLSGEVGATCTTVGPAGNGLLDINSPIDWAGTFAITVSNSPASQGGADVQGDEDYRLQLYAASDSYSNAGSYGGYEFFAKKTSTAIGDVSVTGPEDLGNPGDVLVTVLLADGTFPDQPMLDLVKANINADRIRPLTDRVRVAVPSGVPYSVEVRYWVDDTQIGQESAIQDAVNKAMNAWVNENSLALGGSINPSSLHVAVMEAGASYAIVDEPPDRIQLEKWEVPIITDDPIAQFQGNQTDFPPGLM
jgi:phage-related baseplate assembly protein